MANQVRAQENFKNIRTSTKKKSFINSTNVKERLPGYTGLKTRSRNPCISDVASNLAAGAESSRRAVEWQGRSRFGYCATCIGERRQEVGSARSSGQFGSVLFSSDDDCKSSSCIRARAAAPTMGEETTTRRTDESARESG